jgi:hypothetical protein
MLFLVSGGKEIPVWEAQKNGWVLKPDVLPAGAGGRYAFETDIPIAKVFILEAEFAKARLTYSYYIKFEVPARPQTVEVRSYSDLVRKQKWFFKTRGRILTKKEVIESGVVEQDSLSYKLLLNTQPIPLETHQKMLTITLPKEIEQQNAIRFIRMKQGG